MPNSKENQNCMNCAHFQPYENANPVITDNGECRFRPAQDYLENTGVHFNQYWPYISDGSNFWCSTWKKTDLAPITQSGQRDPDFDTDWAAFHAAPWNRRASMNQSCWNCNHYQWDKEDPQPGQNTGQCRKLPPPSVLDFDDGVESFLGESVKWSYAGSSYFCSCWEFNEGTVPPDPGPGG